MRSLRRLMPLLPMLTLLVTSAAHAQTVVQLWLNMMAEWQTTPSWLVTFDLEPKVLAMGEGQWSNLDLTTSAEYAVLPWLDLMGELVTGYTHDDENPEVGEVTERLGLRLYPWRKRFQVRDTFRLEQRNRFYTDGTQDHMFRSRNRIELRYVLARARSSEAGAWILLADYEYFITIDHTVNERYASRHRIRVGVGYRWSVAWRVDLLYFYQDSRNTYDGNFPNHDHIIDVRFRRAF